MRDAGGGDVSGVVSALELAAVEHLVHAATDELRVETTDVVGRMLVLTS